MLIRTKRAQKIKTLGIVLLVIFCLAGIPMFFVGLIDTLEGEFNPLFVAGISSVIIGLLLFFYSRILSVIVEAAVRTILKYEEEEEKEEKERWESIEKAQQ